MQDAAGDWVRDGRGNLDIPDPGRDGQVAARPNLALAGDGLADLVRIGNGTACLVRSSPLPDDGRQRMCCVNLMGGERPHPSIGIRNNLGAETRVR